MYEFPWLKYVLWIVSVLPFLLLIPLHNKREADEPVLGLKLVGYVILGAFTFRINQFGIPLGFFVYGMFFRPAVNAAVKRKAAYLGLLVFAIMFIYCLLPDMRRVERSVELPVSNDNVYRMSWQKDQRRLAGTLREYLSVSDFSFSFEPDGALRELRMTMTGSKTTGYFVSLRPDSRQYQIRYTEEYPKEPGKPMNRQPPPFPNSLLPVITLFTQLDRLRMQDMLPEGVFDYFTVVVPPGIYYGKFKAPQDPSYLVRGADMTKLSPGEELELPSYYHLFVQGMVTRSSNPPGSGDRHVVSSSSAAGKHFYIVP
ncbi:hypothetical protein ACFQI7_10685 [Paenibacillus allorhizosphaerae]|uniref:hypothetical protein n=1 Tax=Paenibacillus allorhizosphaerae TaxID=2849866 RepID=UPI001C406F68|nr:hypothetical protein [Paenibacillus allorhizosphaerae]